MKKSLLFIFLACGMDALCQQVIRLDGVNCGLHGSSRRGSREYDLNPYKNRYALPAASDMDGSVTLERLKESADPNEFSQKKAVTISAYVYDVKAGGVESCNCKTRKTKYRDTHIELTPDAAHTDSSYRVVVEVTPRLRASMAKKGVDWSTAKLKRTLVGHRVTVKGWLFYDVEHEDQASANDPDDQIGRKNFRATCWEVHPITSLKKLD